MRIDNSCENIINTNAVSEVSKGTVNGAALTKAVVADPGSMTMNSTVMDKRGIMEGLSFDGSIEDLKNTAVTLKDNLSVIFNKMDTGTAVEIGKEGIDINNTDDKKMVTVVEQIQIKLAMYCDDFNIQGMDINIDDIKNTIGGGAAVYKVASELKNKGITPTENNVSQIMQTMDTFNQLKPMDMNTKAYMVKNDMEPSVNNVYIAEHSGYRLASGGMSDNQWNEIRPQAEKMLQDAGLEISEANMDMCKLMVDNDIELTTDNLQKFDALNEIPEDNNQDIIIERMVAALIEGRTAKDTLITGESLPWEETAMAIQTIESATAGNIMAWSQSSDDRKQYTLEGLSDIENNNIEETPNEGDYKYIKSYRELLEVRLMMTIDAGRTLEKNGISINTTEITDLIDKLKQYETDYFNTLIEDGEKPVTLMDTAQVNQVMTAVDSLRSVPAAVIGSVTQAGETPSVNSFLYHVPAVTSAMAAAGEAYEALSTEVRSDLGDSVAKAVKASMPDILAGLGLEDNDANRRAVRILAYNQMDMSEDNIDKVKSVDWSVNELFRNMNPEIALKMIRDNINPLETSVEELNEYFTTEAEAVRPAEEKYSEFLYRMDKKGKISQEEREKFIGIYSLVSKFQKDGLNAVGQLVNQNMDITMGNLLTAYMIRKDSGTELIADTDTGTAEVSDKVTYYKHLFAAAAKHTITPDMLSQVSDELDDMSPEEFIQQLGVSEPGEEDPVYQQYIENCELAARAQSQELRLLIQNNIPATYNNIVAAQQIMSSKASDIFGRLANRNEETVEDKIITSMDSREEINNAYDELLQQSRELVNSAVYNTDDYLDMKALRQLGNTMSLVNNLAKRNTYFIPYDNNGSSGIINLKIVENGSNQGTFTIKMSKEDLGELTVEGKVNNESITVAVMSNSEEGLGILQEMLPQLKQTLAAGGFDNTRVYTGKVDSQPDTTGKVAERTETGRIFQAARLFITELTK